MADKSCSVRLPSFSGAFIILRIFRQEFVINSKTSLYNLRFVSKCFQGDFPFLFMGFPLSKPLQKAFIPKIIWEIEATEVSFYLDHRFRMKIIGWKLNGKSLAVYPYNHNQAWLHYSHRISLLYQSGEFLGPFLP